MVNQRKSEIAAPSSNAGGFALVVTLSLMILLTLVAVGLLSLATVSIRSSSQSRAEAEARANARMALMFAIGELQKHTGQDTRITAPAEIVEPNAPTLTGVWKSWEGTDHDSTGRPIKPDYSVKTKAQSNNGRFLTWLVSGAESGTAPLSPSPSSLVSNTSTNGTIPLLSSHTLGSNPGQVHVRPQLLKNNTGAFAWWVSPENQKARLVQPHKPRTNDIAGLVGMGQSHPVSNPSVFGLESLLDDPENFIPNANYPKPADKAFTLSTTKLLAGSSTSKPQENFHDLSANSTGLLTNTATGGWRKDLSLLTEKWDSIYASYSGGRLPLFRFTPKSGDTTKVPKPTASSYDPAQSNLYPWSAYSVIIGDKLPCTYQAASASWQSLVSFATSYKNFTYTAGSVTSPFVWDKILSSNASSLGGQQMFNYKHKQLLYPQIARFQFLVYAQAIEDPARLNQNPKKYQIKLMYVPLFTLWNPYNVALEHTISGTQNASQGSGAHTNFLGFGWRRSPPGAMAIVNQQTYPNPDSVPPDQFKLFTPGNFQVLDKPGNNANPYDTDFNKTTTGYNGRWVDKRTFGCWLPEGKLTFKPGEVKIFSPGWSDPAYGLSGVLRLKEGYDPGNIVGSEFGALSNLLGNQSFWFLMKTDRVTQPFINRVPGNGFSLSFADGSDHFGANGTMPTGPGNEFHNLTSLASASDAQKYWPADEVGEVPYSIGQLAGGRWIPLFSITFGPRMTIGTGQGTDQNRPTKGVVQNNALAAMVLSDPASNKAKDYPANNTFDFAYHSLAAGSNITPNLSTSAGYIATGYQSGDGLSRLIMVDIPLRPMASLVELQGWNPRGNNPYPPFQMNLIGNSDATPLIPNDNIVPSVLEPSGNAFNLQHDDAYCANHLLFDDWFVSSIAPQPQILGGNISKDIENFYRDFLTNKERLSNRSYMAIAEDTGLSSAQAEDRIQKIIKSQDGWLKVASRLEVGGMFNVNSTSVQAWKALLGHAKSRENIAMHGRDRIESTSLGKTHSVTRSAVASDVEAGSEPAIGGSVQNASEYTGFRNLTDDQIGDLAAKIVEQIRLRGPFLSLSEFVNRQLTSNNNLALAGAVQTAINNLEKDPMKVLRNPNNGLSDNTMASKDPNNSKVKDAEYAFPKAAEGSSAFGAPGWIRQADVLRPIAPILNARDDTFTIRAYGDSKDKSGNIIAKAWCEAVVKRTRDFCDPSDAADSIEPPASAANATFGRRYQIVSFRWLHPDEV